MSNTQVKESLREQARKCRERKEVQERQRRTEQELLNRCRGVIEALGQAVCAMRRSLDPWEAPPTEAELEQHYRKVVPLLAETLAALRESDLVSKLAQLNEAATLAHYRQQHDDPQEIQFAYTHARQIREADTADRFRLKELVQDAVEEPGLRRAWDWVSNLLCGLTGQQKLAWQSERESPSARPEEGSVASGAQGAGIAKGKRKAGKRPLEQSNPLKYQVYERIRRAHQPGGAYVETVRGLKDDKDFMEQVEEAGEKLNTKLVRKALALFSQRPRDQARKQQETDPA